MGFFDTKTISSVEVLGITTGFQTGVLATYNFPVYNFLVHYTDGTSKTTEIAADGALKKAQIDGLLKYVKTETPSEPSKAPVTPLSGKRDKSAVYDDLKKVKDLFDAGILTEEMFEKEKNELLGELKNIEEAIKAAAAIPAYNLMIIRNKPRPRSEEKTLLYVDGVLKAEYDLDQDVKLLLEPGKHKVRFSRAAIRSPEYDVDVSYKKVSKVTFTPKVFTIEVSVY